MAQVIQHWMQAMMLSRGKVTAALLVATVVFFSTVTGQPAYSQANQSNLMGAPDVDSNVDIYSESDVKNDASSQSGGNVFDFSSNSSRNTPPAPSIGAFGGGSCVGPGQAVSGSAPGFSLGYGKSFEDESCQRRNWVQTLIGAAQHMPQEEANALKKAAIEIMMQDEYAGDAFRALGYESAKERLQKAESQQSTPADIGRSSIATEPNAGPPPNIGQIARSCVVVVPRAAPESIIRLLKSQGCSLEVQ